MLILSIIVGIALQVGLISIPPISAVFKVTQMDSSHWGMVIGLSLIPLIVNEIIKVVTRKNS